MFVFSPRRSAWRRVQRSFLALFTPSNFAVVGVLLSVLFSSDPSLFFAFSPSPSLSFPLGRSFFVSLSLTLPCFFFFFFVFFFAEEELRSIDDPMDPFTRKDPLSPPGLSLFSVAAWCSHHPWRLSCTRAAYAVSLCCVLWLVRASSLRFLGAESLCLSLCLVSLFKGSVGDYGMPRADTACCGARHEL